MNIPNLQRLRDHIAALPPERIQMPTLFGALDPENEIDLTDIVVESGLGPALDSHDCGTCACIAGWALYLFHPSHTLGGGSLTSGAAASLGLNNDQATELFTPPNFEDPGRYTQADVIRTLDHLIATGEVKWD